MKGFAAKGGRRPVPLGVPPSIDLEYTKNDLESTKHQERPGIDYQSQIDR